MMLLLKVLYGKDDICMNLDELLKAAITDPSKRADFLKMLIRSDVYVKPNDNRYKVYIIESANKMTHEAQNAFLKVLEEPPEYAVFIMLCESSDAMLITVKSRATVYSTERFTESVLYEYLVKTSSTAAGLASENPDVLRLAIMTANGIEPRRYPATAVAMYASAYSMTKRGRRP